MEPMVSICCAAYNHAPYIAQALESFLAQDVPIEILVHDDASTDGTQDILRDYARRYPDVVRPLFETENQYSRGVAIDPTFNYPRARGKYIALCEGDDCWCDPHKLRRQVDYMEAHPDCTFCFTNGMIRDADGRAPDLTAKRTRPAISPPTTPTRWAISAPSTSCPRPRSSFRDRRWTGCRPPFGTSPAPTATSSCACI